MTTCRLSRRMFQSLAAVLFCTAKARNPAPQPQHPCAKTAPSYFVPASPAVDALSPARSLPVARVAGTGGFVSSHPRCLPAVIGCGSGLPQETCNRPQSVAALRPRRGAGCGGRAAAGPAYFFRAPPPRPSLRFFWRAAKAMERRTRPRRAACLWHRSGGSRGALGAGGGARRPAPRHVGVDHAEGNHSSAAYGLG